MLSHTNALSQRRLVLEYLCHHCYVNTARAFSQDSKRISCDDESSSNGLEYGYGRRPIDRDLVTGALLNHEDHTATEVVSASIGTPQQQPSPYLFSIPHAESTPDAITNSNDDAGTSLTLHRASSVAPALSLKDADGDEFMSPPPDEFQAVQDTTSIIQDEESRIVDLEVPHSEVAPPLSQPPESIAVDAAYTDIKESAQEGIEPSQDEAMLDVADRSSGNEAAPAMDGEPRDDMLYHVELRKSMFSCYRVPCLRLTFPPKPFGGIFYGAVSQKQQML